MRRALFALGIVTAVFMVVFWSAVFSGLSPIEELVPGHRAWVLSFPLVDAWVGAWAGRVAWCLRRRAIDASRRAALVSGSGLVFLGVHELTYGVYTGLALHPKGGEIVEVLVQLYCLVVGALFLRWGFEAEAVEAGAP